MSDDQRAALEALVCERFSTTTSNKKILETFENEKGSLLITYANERGFDEDERGDTAFYIVKTRAGHGLFFFSLKCGELFHLCANRNESVMRIWDESGMRRPMGEVLFWQFVAPLFLKIRTFVGCEYAFLFAADMSPDLSLIHYYEQALRFMQDASIGANKPAYDFCCSFMCQPLRELAKNRKNYFEHFNDKVM